MPIRLLPVVLIALTAPAAAQSPDRYTTNSDYFDLKCSRVPGGAVERVLHVDVDPHGQFEISVSRDGRRVVYPTGTYANAVVWNEGNDRWILDRFKATLQKKGVAGEWSCEREGGRKF